MFIEAGLTPRIFGGFTPRFMTSYPLNSRLKLILWLSFLKAYYSIIIL